MQNRGQLTERIKKKSKEILGYEITQQELRLMPHLHYVATNDKILQYIRLSDLECDILNKWEEQGKIKISQRGVLIFIDKNFYNSICEIIYLGYVDIKI